MKDIDFMENRQNLQNVLTTSFRVELQSLNAELQSTLIDDMITAFYNRLKVMKKIQETQEKRLK